MPTLQKFWGPHSPPLLAEWRALAKQFDIVAKRRVVAAEEREEEWGQIGKVNGLEEEEAGGGGRVGQMRRTDEVAMAYVQRLAYL